MDWQTHAIDLLARLANPSVVSAGPSFDESVRARLVQAKIDGLEWGDPRAPAPLQRVYRRVWQAQLEATREAVAGLRRWGIDPLLFKGVEIVARHFADHPPSMMADIDILVPRQQVGPARAALLVLGYRQATYVPEQDLLRDADVADIARVEGAHYELFPFRRIVPFEVDTLEFAALQKVPDGPVHLSDSGTACLVLEIDVHHGVALDVETAPLIERSQLSIIEGARTLGSTDHLWVTTARFYSEVAVHGKRSLRDFAYVIALLRHEQFDWDLLLSITAHYESRPALFYFLTFASSLFATSPVPADVLARIDPRLGVRLRDWGWQLGPLFDQIDPAPSYAQQRSRTMTEAQTR